MAFLSMERPREDAMAAVDRQQRSFLRRDFMRGVLAGAGAVAAHGTVWRKAAWADPAACDGSTDLALVNGKILTMDPTNPVVSAVAIRNGRFSEIGHQQALGPCSRTINLHGATVIPGLIDSHVHYIRCGLNPGHEARIIETATSIPDLQTKITRRIARLGLAPGEFVTCIGGWNINGLLEGRLPTLSELDKAAPHNPVYLSTTGPGGAVTNTLGKAFFTSRIPPVAVNADGTLNAGQGLAALQAAQTDASKQQGTAEVMDFAASLGVTMFHDHGGLSGLQPYDYALNLWREKKLKVRVRPWFWSGDDTSCTNVAEARISNDYNMVGDDVWRQLGVGERICTSTTDPQNPKTWLFAAQQGWMVTQHSLTPQEVAFHISAYQSIDAQIGHGIIGALRWSLCHVNPITEEQIKAVKDLGIGLNIQGTPYTSVAGTTPAGPPFRELLDAGIPCGGGSDATNVAAFNPWLMMFYMTTGKNNAGTVINDSTQTIKRMEALRMYTLGSAYLSWDDDKLGSIEVGKIADLAVLSDNPLTVSDADFKKLKSTLTLQAGQIVYSAS
jgi:predicted amidohydrolase YtcJ